MQADFRFLVEGGVSAVAALAPPPDEEGCPRGRSVVLALGSKQQSCAWPTTPSA
jgi:hypothetical protein